MLAGITVVDFSRHLPGPFCTMRLADLGAEVIKLETHPAGDPGRGMGPKVACSGALFHSSNRNKKSVALNLRTSEGKELAYRLASQADVIVESFRPGVMSLLGLDYERLSAGNEAIVYCSVTGYGQSGAMRQLGGHDLNFQAVSGLLSTIRDSEGRPVIAEVPLADFACGMYAAEQICAALIGRFRTGRGAYLDIAAVDALASWMGMHALFVGQAETAKEMTRFFKSHLAYHVFETADGKYVALAALEEKFWLNFCRAVGREDWEGLHGAGKEDHPDVFEELKALFLSRTQAEWSELGHEVDCCLTAVEEADTWTACTYVQSRELLFPLYGSELGKTLQVRTHPHVLSGRMSEYPAWAPPAYGAHTRRVLAGKLGLSASDLSRLEAEGVIPVTKK
ncbi:CoA transferase [Brevibacillus composti]|uniref:CoA transferase n=1 Tax=Brevibacillus composti TaxID=2796470 RepID=A0A7T5JQ94_9BACL|nr:CaiB/BaiF CoA-transferase family protein [Brevibacillus composti]QQE75992.1 CoA transferase [Brevibacillus composti]QUO43018.1 CoA transferase [Brevibacillus composti]